MVVTGNSHIHRNRQDYRREPVKLNIILYKQNNIIAHYTAVYITRD